VHNHLACNETQCRAAARQGRDGEVARAWVRWWSTPGCAGGGGPQQVVHNHLGWGQVQGSKARRQGGCRTVGQVVQEHSMLLLNASAADAQARQICAEWPYC
jgi:hypothetical protein